LCGRGDSGSSGTSLLQCFPPVFSSSPPQDLVPFGEMLRLDSSGPFSSSGQASNNVLRRDDFKLLSFFVPSLLPLSTGRLPSRLGRDGQTCRVSQRRILGLREQSPWSFVARACSTSRVQVLSLQFGPPFFLVLSLFSFSTAFPASFFLSPSLSVHRDG